MTHFLVIGLGSIGRRHALNLATEHPGARLTFVRHRGDVDGFGRHLDARVVTDLSDVLDDSIDLAVLATPSASHVDILPTLIERGWPLLVEKPIVAAAEDCDEIDAALRVADPAVRVAGFNLRYVPSIRRMKAAIDAGDVGHVVRASFTAGQWLPDWRPDTDYRASYSADSARGGGVELDLAHEFDVARWLLGELQIDYARGGKFSDLELQANDTSVSVLSPNDAPDPVVTVALDYVARRRVRRYEVVGDRGRIEWDIDGDLSLETAAGRCPLAIEADGFDVGRSYETMLQDVLRAVESGDVDRVQPLADGLASTRLALEARDRGGSS
ncbi:Gfo/Idh/MocA family protein [Ilumatobacter sp.]|uniref:Gfo/Idh/MocA family protein n=1 Tax=Ilumatobacter sp. TaxID=1967498 RepID=UPI003AF542C0